MRLLPLTLLLAGCAAVGPETGGRDAEALARELAGRVAGAAQQCVPIFPSNASLQVADRQTLVYRQGGTFWVNRLPEGCPGFNRLDTLIVEVHGGRYCRNDRVRSVPMSGGIPGPVCLLGEFVPYRRP